MSDAMCNTLLLTPTRSGTGRNIFRYWLALQLTPLPVQCLHVLITIDEHLI